jgi:hypothetical protein
MFMANEKRFLHKDPNYRQATHNRWMDGKVQRNRDIDSSEYDEKWETWSQQQCFMCQFYVQLEGQLGMDWGACTNELSAFDGCIMYEHDGCEHFSFAEDEEL